MYSVSPIDHISSVGPEYLRDKITITTWFSQLYINMDDKQGDKPMIV